jgi:hypothetical protein
MRHASKHFNVVLVGNLDLFDQLQLFLVVEIGAQFADRLDGALAVRGLDGECSVDVAHLAPFRPAAFDRAERADKHPIHVKKNSANQDLHRTRVAVTSPVIYHGIYHAIRRSHGTDC